MNKTLKILFGILFSIAFYNLADAAVFKEIKVGKIRTRVMDCGDRAESTLAKYVRYYYDDFRRTTSWPGRGWTVAVANWTDKDDNFWPIKMTGAGQVGPADEVESVMPVPDAEDVYIHRYFRYQPPSITVDGYSLEDPFPLTGDEVNPGKIPGTADVMIESYVNTFLGVSIRMREYGWSQAYMDEFTIQDWTLFNTGNVDLDDDIELPTQTLDSLYFWHTAQIHSGARPWCVYYGEYMADSMRISYTYPSRRQSATFDTHGYRRSSEYLPTYWIDHPYYFATSVLHVDTSPDDPTDDPSQPMMSGYTRMEWPFYRLDRYAMGAADLLMQWQSIKESTVNQVGEALEMNEDYDTGDGTGVWPGSHHALDMDMRGFVFRDEGHYKQGYGNNYYSIGPFTLEPGDSLRIVRAWLWSSISPEKGFEVGQAWGAGTAADTWEGPPGWLPPNIVEHPEHAPTENDLAKDYWVFTGRDSLFASNWAAQWAVREGYDVPIPPAPPSITVTSLPDNIKIEWGSESESDATDFAGYRLYRAQGNPGAKVVETQLVGVWELIFECGEGTANALAHEFEDTDATGLERGMAYYYYVAAFDDLSENVANQLGRVESYESGPYLNSTTRAAYLTRPAGTLSAIRVVPNPFNVASRDMQYIGEPDKIMFLDLPGECTIRIYTESGDLIKTIEHTDGSGDETWGDVADEHSATDTGQIVVSGVYIAYIETPDGESIFKKFLIIR